MRVVALYALAGVGHQRAAQAVQAAAQARGHHAQTHDALEYTNLFTRWLYPRLYLFLISWAPALWGWGYLWLDARWQWRPIARLRRLVNGCVAGRLSRWLIAEQPDVVCTTHFLPAEVVASLRRDGRLRARLIVAVTDLHPHAFWIVPGADHYAVASEGTRQTLIARGVAAERITVTGIPVDPRFAALPSSSAARARLQLPIDRPVALLTGGGFGVGPIRDIVRRVVARDEARGRRLCLAVVCGHHPSLVRALERLSVPREVTLRVFGFTEEMPSLMAASDVLVTKPGGLTVSEALAVGLPMILYGTIPGQEAHNEQFLLEQGVAVVAERPRAVADALAAWLRDPAQVDAMRRRMAVLQRPHAALDLTDRLIASP